MPEQNAMDRMLQLFEMLVRDEGKNPLSLHAEALGLSTSAVYRMVQLLRHHGLLVPAKRGHYVAGLTLSELSRHSDPHTILATSARPLLKALAAAAGATAHLGVMDGDMITYVIKEQGGAVPLFTQEGGQLEAYCSAIGRVLLANMAEPCREAYLAAGPFVALTSHTLIDPIRIRDLLAEVERFDFAVDDREIADDLVCVAVPVRRKAGVLAAISLSMVQPILEIDQALDALRTCAARIESRLG